MKQQSCSCSAHILPPLLPCTLWTRPWDMSAHVCWGCYFIPDAGHTETQQHPQSCLWFFFFPLFFPLQICLLEMNHLPGSKWLIAQCVTLLGEGKGECELLLGRLACNHHVTALDAFNNNKNKIYFSRNLSTFVFRTDTWLVKSIKNHLSCCTTITDITECHL